MKLISFDIGIRNMAYCVFLVDPYLVVQDWQVVSLMDEVPESAKHTCICPLKTPKKKSGTNLNAEPKLCGRTAVFEKAGHYYCAKHAKEWVEKDPNQHILPEKEISTVALKRLSKEALTDLCKKRAIPLDPLATKPIILDTACKWFNERVFRTIVSKKSTSAKETDLITIGRNIKSRLQSIVEMEGATHVIMENQISPLAGRMKTVQGMLAQYYIMQTPSPHIEFISSANKLKDFVQKPLANTVEPADMTLRQIYTQHKTDAISVCTSLLAANPGLGSWTLADPKKKDDLADCFLQGIWYLKHAKYIIYAENLKINLV